MTISVIIFSHNPHADRMNRVLEALKNQEESPGNWELIMIDNLSDKPIETQFDFSWHPNVKHFIEPNLGISNARSRGIHEASGELLIMVDDDAELYPNYIRLAKSIALEYPQIGCFGGNMLSATNIKAPSHYRKYLEMIGFRTIKRNQISNLYLWETTPAGPGMVIYAHIAKQYAQKVDKQQPHAALGRRGKSLMSSEDIDLAYQAIEMGYYNGLFAALKLNHLTIEEHLNDQYMIRRRYYNVMSSHMLNYIRFKQMPKRIPRSTYYITQALRLLRREYFEYQMKKMEFLATREIRKSIYNGDITRTNQVV
jgi:glycosyltransferase involved in cell wall biosynthesis